MSCQQIKVKLACIPGVMNTIFLAIIFNHYVDFSKKGKQNKTKQKNENSSSGLISKVLRVQLLQQCHTLF